MKKIVNKLSSLILLSTACISINAFAATNSTVDTISKNTGIQPKIIELALKAQKWAIDHTSNVNKDLLTIVDYSKPAIQERLYVINLKTDELMMKLRVAHGKNSGLPNAPAEHFSNSPKSLESSLGVFVTADAFVGKHGTARHVRGLEPNINDNAYSRTIEIHPAAYVNENFVGRSWGCFAVPLNQAPKLVNMLGVGTVIFAYAPKEEHDENIIHETL